METTIKSGLQSGSHQKTIVHTSSPFFEKMEAGRFAVIALMVIVLGCAGGIAAAFGAGTNVIALALIAFPTILALAFILAVAPIRIIFYSGVIAVALDLLVLLF